MVVINWAGVRFVIDWPSLRCALWTSRAAGGRTFHSCWECWRPPPRGTEIGTLLSITEAPEWVLRRRQTTRGRLDGRLLRQWRKEGFLPRRQGLRACTWCPRRRTSVE